MKGLAYLEEELDEDIRNALLETCVFKVGDTVLYKAEFNTGNYSQDEMIPGTVITRFMNGDNLTYRIRLDVGQGVIVGNISSHRMFLQ